MTGLYTLDSAALHARLGLLAALASARKNLMLLPSGGGGSTALQRLQLVGEIARARKELGGVADDGRDERISADEAARLFADLKRLNADPEWGGGDGHRYEFIAKRIDAASEGRPDAVKLAREWLSDMGSRVDEAQQQEIAAQSERDVERARYAAEVAAGRSGNPLFQAWLDTLEDPASAKNYQYIIWNSRRGAEFDKLWTGSKRGLNGKASDEYRQAREAYFRRWADEHLSERVKAQRGAQAEGESLGSPDAEAAEIVEHTTVKGKVLRGVVRHGLTLAEAQKVDKYTFRKDGGYFIREKYLQQPKAAEPAAPDAGAARAELDAMTAEAQRRMTEAAESVGVGVALSGAEIDYLTPEEKARRHELLEQLREPDSAEQARERVQERVKARKEAAAELSQAKRRNQPLEYTGYSGQARSVKSYYEAGGYRIAKPHEGLFEVIDGDGQAIHQMAGLGGALSVVQRLGGDRQATWEKLHAKVWKSSDGMYIVDEGFTSGGRPVKMFAVYASQDDRHAGNNFASGESLAEAKRKATGVALDDAGLLLDAAGGMDRLALMAELRRAMEALGAADDPAVRLYLLAEVARLRRALEGGADAQVVELAGDELGDFPDTPEGKKALRDAAIGELTKLRGAWLDCPALGAQVEIRKRGIDKIKSASADPLKLKIIPRIKEILASATKIGSKPNYDIANSPSTAAYHTLQARVRVAGLERQVRIVVTEDDKGLFHYDHTLHEEDAILDSTKSEGPADAEPSGLMGGNLGFTRDLRAAPGATSLLPPELSGEHQPDSRIAERPLVLNLFIEGEPPEPAEGDEE